MVRTYYAAKIPFSIANIVADTRFEVPVLS